MPYSAGTKNRVTNRANNTPKARLIPIGINHCACRDRSVSSGSRPTKVVSDVSRIGRNRRVPASTFSWRLKPALF